MKYSIESHIICSISGKICFWQWCIIRIFQSGQMLGLTLLWLIENRFIKHTFIPWLYQKPLFGRVMLENLDVRFEMRKIAHTTLHFCASAEQMISTPKQSLLIDLAMKCVRNHMEMWISIKLSRVFLCRQVSFVSFSASNFVYRFSSFEELFAPMRTTTNMKGANRRLQIFRMESLPFGRFVHHFIWWHSI